MQKPLEQEALLLSEEKTLLFNRYGRAIFAYVRLHTNSREECKDITLEVFQIALKYNDLSAIPEERQLIWLRSVASRKIVDRYRRATRHPEIGLEGVTQRLFNDETSDPEWLAVQQEKHHHLLEMVQKLPLKEQQILRLHYGDQLTFAEIGILFEKRESTVRKHHARIIAKLRKFYSKQKGE